MPDRKYSVDDIIGEIELNKAMREHRKPTRDMQRIDDVIREILTQKKEEELKRENRTLTEKERISLEKEIKAQTRTLTKQFAKLKREQQKNQAPASASQKEEIRLAQVKKEQQVKAKPLPALKELPPERKENKEQKLEELKRVANTQRLRSQMNDIADHFGNFELSKEADARLQQGMPADASIATAEDAPAGRTEITVKNYKEYKNKRNKKVGSFVLDPERKQEQAAETGEQAPVQNAPEIEEIDDETAAVQLEAERRMQTRSFEYKYEYTSRAQTEQVGQDLHAIRRSVKTSLIALGAIAVNAFILCFVKMSESSVLLLGKLPITPFLYCVINLTLLVLALAVGGSIFKNVFESISKGHPNKDVLYLVSALACLGVNIAICFQPEQILKADVNLYTPIAVLLLFVNFIGKYQTICKTINNFKFVSSTDDKYAVIQIDDVKTAMNMTKGVLDESPVLVKNVKTDFFENFLAHSFKYDVSDTMSRTASMIAVPLAFVLGVVGYFMTKDLYIALTLLCGTLILASGFVCAIMVSFPLYDSADIVNRFAGMMPGYDSIEEYKDTNSIILDACDLFPAKSIVLHGIKTFQGKRIDDAILDAASVVCASKSVFTHIFLGIINNKTNLLKKVDSVQYEDLMGLSAWVDEKRVLIGNRELMINHSIAVPKKSYEEKYHNEGSEVVYLATGGELCAAFIVEFTTERTVADVVRLLAKNDMTAIVRTVDASITPDLLSQLFQTDEGVFKILPSRLHPDFEAEMRPCAKLDSMLGNNGTLFGYIVSLAATKKLHNCIRLGALMYLISAICGVTLLVTMFFLGKLGGLGTMQILLFLAVFPFIYWVYEKNMHL